MSETLPARRPGLLRGYMRIVAAMTIQIGISFSISELSTPALGSPPIPTPGGQHVAQVIDFSRDQTLFDSGAQLGLAQAAVPLSGTTDAPDGTVIQARAVSLDDGGATSTAWADAGTAAGSAWSGSLDVPRSTSWFRVEVRVKGSNAPAGQTANRFGVGHIWAYFEQSNSARIFNSGYSQTPVPPVTDPEALQVFQVDRNTGTATRTLVSDATPVSASVARIANVLAAERPGEKFAIAAHVQPGTSPFEMIDDTDPDRVWAYEQNLHDLVAVDGAAVGAVFDTGWIAWSPKPDNEDRIIPILTGKLRDGTVLSPGATVSGNWGSYVLSHDLREFYDFAYTRVGLVGPHGRAATASQSDYETAADLDYMNMVDDWNAVLSDSANFPEFLPYVMETVGALRGVDDGNGGWTDEAHHSATDPDGLERLAQTQALLVLQTLGLANWPVPAFDSVYYEPSGAYADFWMDGQDITTLRDLRNGAGSSVHVRGWTLNGVPLTTEAQIVTDAGGSGFAGVRITPASPLDYGSNIQFGRGRLPGFLNYPGDYQTGYHQDLPVVDLGQGGLDAMTMKGRSTEGLGNTLPAPAQFTTVSDGTAAGTGPYFEDSSGHTFGSGVTSLRMEITGAISDTNGGSWLLASGGGVIGLELLASGLIRSNGGGKSGVPLVTTATPIALGTAYTWTLVLDLTAGTFTLDQDDGTGAVRVIDAALSAQPTTLAGGRYPVLLRKNGSSQMATQVLGSFSSIRMWRNDTTGAGAPWIDISGDAAAINAHPLKQGADAL